MSVFMEKSGMNRWSSHLSGTTGLRFQAGWLPSDSPAYPRSKTQAPTLQGGIRQ
jgi:hypothetical protein